MNTLLRQLTTALLTTAATAAFADVNSASAQSVVVTAPPAALVAARAVLQHGVDATYAMSSGRNMVVSSYRDSLNLRYGRRLRAVMQHDGNGNFVSGDGKLSLQFELDRQGEPQAVRLSMPADLL